MPKFEREGKILKVIFDTGFGYPFGISADCISDFYAILTKNAISNYFSNKVKSFAIMVYERGYRDGRSKIKKMEYFPDSLDSKV